MKLSKHACLAVAVGMTVVAAAAEAEAHPRLVTATPAPNGVAKGSPSVLRATFSEPLVAVFSGFQVKTAAGVLVPTGKPALDPRNRRTIVAAVVRPLAPGGYIVNWRAVSADTHRLTGRYAFRVTR